MCIEGRGREALRQSLSSVYNVTGRGNMFAWRVESRDSVKSPQLIAKR